MPAKPKKTAAPSPPTREMTIVAQDPAVKRNGRILMARINVPAEDLTAGPMGYRVHVVDYDATEQRFHGAHKLPDDVTGEPRSWQQGQASLVKDYRFHAQNVYALVMKTLARFEFALGRRIGWSFRTHQLKIAPHGMLDANAFYSPGDEGLVFGYFEGARGQPVYTCLSHDIVVHEATHALLDSLRERYMYPSGPDQAAFHEGFADVVALLSVFSLPEVVAHLLDPRGGAVTIQRRRLTVAALRKSALFGLADQMGEEMEGVRGAPLRQSAAIPPDKKILGRREFLEPHRRGEVFVAAVMNTFIAAWSEAIDKLSVKGQSALPLAAVVQQGADIADTMATMWIRALDYIPTVHLVFGDALSAVLTADEDIRPDDSRYRLRAHHLAAFAMYGIKPASGETSGAWSAPPPELRYERVRFESMKNDKDEVFRFLWENRKELELRDGAFTQVISVRPCTRVGPDGFVLRETVSEYYQVARLTPAELKARNVELPEEYVETLLATAHAPGTADLEGAADGDEGEAAVTAVYGGGVLIFDEYGKLKHWIHKDVFSERQTDRLGYLWNEGFLIVDRGISRYRRARFSTMHLRRAMDARFSMSEGW